MQQNTSRWLLDDDCIKDTTIDPQALRGLGTSEGGPGRLSGRMELPQSGGNGGGVRGRLALPGFPEERVS